MTAYRFICAKSSADFVVPDQVRDLADLARKTRIFSRGLVGGVLRVGDYLDRPSQNSVGNHLLCNGSTISRGTYPELVDLLNAEAGLEAGLPTATLPTQTEATTYGTPTVTQTVSDSGTVSTGGTVTDAGDTGGTTGGNVPSGGRLRDPPGGVVAPP